jgi:hypothetical protein
VEETGREKEKKRKGRGCWAETVVDRIGLKEEGERDRGRERAEAVFGTLSF